MTLAQLIDKLTTDVVVYGLDPNKVRVQFAEEFCYYNEITGYYFDPEEVDSAKDMNIILYGE